MSTCNVCVEDFNKTNRAKVTCKCGFEACRECIKKYLMDQTTDTHCMSCKVQWNRQFLNESFEKTFITKTWKTYREKLLFEKELAMMPETQAYVEKLVNIEKKENEKKNMREELTKFIERFDACDKELGELKNSEIDTSRREFIRHCPNGDCRGFLNTSLKCNLCEMWACGDCREVKGETRDTEHVCKEEIVASVKQLEKDTKPCPKCSSSIFKINGCDQIWCYKCHTAFNWKTLKIETGTIHNPEYFEYLRRSGKEIERTEGDVPCGRELSNYFVSRVKNIFPQKIMNITRAVIHIKSVDLIRFETRNVQDVNRDIRIKYMMNKIDTNKMKFLLQKREKENQKKTEISNVLKMYIQCMTDILYRLQEDLDEASFSIKDLYNHASINKYTYEIRNLVEYTNECFEKVAKSYNCKVWTINRYYLE